MKKTSSEEMIEKFPEERRAFLQKAVKAGFAVPVIATFSMSGLMARPAAAGHNMSGHVKSR